MRNVLWVALVLTAATSARAQAPLHQADATFKQKMRSQYLRNDTAQAIINLYSKRQAGGAGWMVASLLTGTRLMLNGGSSTTVNGVVIDQQGPNVGGIALAVAPVLGYGLSKTLRYSNPHLEQQLSAYAAGQPLPRNLRRKLKPRFFNAPIIQYTPVSATPVK